MGCGVRSRDGRQRRGSAVELGESKREGNQEPSIPAARGRFGASPPRGAGPRVCRDGHRVPGGEPRHVTPATASQSPLSHRSPSPPRVPFGGSSSLGLDPWRAPERSEGQRRKTRVGWMSPATPLQPQTCPGTTSTPRRHPAPYPSTVWLPGAGYDPPRGAQSQAQHRSGTPPGSSQSPTCLERSHFISRNQDRVFQNVSAIRGTSPGGLTLLGHRNAMASGHHSAMANGHHNAMASGHASKPVPGSGDSFTGGMGTPGPPSSQRQSQSRGMKVDVFGGRTTHFQGGRATSRGNAGEGCGEPRPSIPIW